MKLLIATILCFAQFAFAQEITFKDRDKVIEKIQLQNLAKLAPSQTLKVWDPNEEAEITFEAYPTNIIFEKVFGKDWVKHEEVLLTCSDGYQPSVPVSRFQKFKGFFAVKRVGSSEFSITNKSEQNKKAIVAPIYLVWDNLKNAEIKAGDGASWPYQVVSIDLQDFAKVFPRLAPPKNSSTNVNRGFLAFRKNCLGCHTINGDGGSGGPELNYPSSVTEYYKDAWLKKWINDPKSVRFKTAMPGLNKDTPNHDAVLNDIISYLKAMTKNKVAPK